MVGFGGTEGFVPIGGRIGDLSLPDDPWPPDLGRLGQKVEIFDGPPLPAPFGTKVPSCPLARGPGAALLVGRGLIGSYSGLTSWIALLGLSYLCPFHYHHFKQQMYHVERLMALQMLNLTFLSHLCVKRQAQARLFHIIERQNGWMVYFVLTFELW